MDEQLTPELRVKNAIVLYHDNCVDGFGAAWAFYALSDYDRSRVNYIPVQYGTIPELPINPLFKQDLYILDFSFSREILVDFATKFNSVTVLDHHKTAEAALTNWVDKPSNLTLVFDQSRSGAKITWDYFLPAGLGDNELIDYIQDRDLWRFSLPESKAINAIIEYTEKTFTAYDLLNCTLQVTSTKNLMAQSGKTLLKYKDRVCAELADQAAPIALEGNYHGLACNCPPQFASEVGDLLAQKSGSFGATYYTAKSGQVKWSVRSIGDYDVSEIAKIFGGGGHRNAAGFLLDPADSSCSKIKINYAT